MYHVYELIDPRNQQPFYVGKGTGIQISRLNDHIQEAMKPKEEQINQLKCAKINKILNDNFEIETSVKYFDNEEKAYSHESDLISQYGRRINNSGFLTNITVGGRGGWSHFGKRVYQFSLDGELLQEFLSTKKAADNIDVTISAIWACLSPSRPNTQCGGFLWNRTPGLTQDQITAVRERKKQKQQVYQIDIYNNVVNRYDTIQSAAREMKVQHNSIRSICENQRGLCKNFFWSYNPTTQLPPRIGQFKNGKIQNVFWNARQAFLFTQISQSRIGLALKQEISSASGYEWKYI